MILVLAMVWKLPGNTRVVIGAIVGQVVVV